MSSMRVCLADPLPWRTEVGPGRKQEETSSEILLGEMDIFETYLGNIDFKRTSLKG